MKKLKLLSLFAGIGGFELGLERSGAFETVAQCEIDPFCNKVLAKHWPNVKRYGDVRELTAARLAADGIAVDAICGGFPCQDISIAGPGGGLAGKRSGLWHEYARLIGEIRPQFVIVENVSELLGNGMGDVLGALASLGYDAEWDSISAADVGARHKRNRVWIVAYPNGSRKLQSEGLFEIIWRWISHARQNVSNAACIRQQKSWWSFNSGNSEAYEDREVYRTFNDRGWPVEPDVGRMAYGVPNGVDRIKGLGNAVVPQIPELIGRAIAASMADLSVAKP
jgi:DNA (cytosine-5)-methyltransferase 1